MACVMTRNERRVPAFLALMAVAATMPVHAANMGALGELVLYGAAAVAVVWCLLSAFVFYCLRRLVAWKQWSLSLGFLVLPAGWLAMDIAIEHLLGQPGGVESVMASTQSVTLAGVVFPAGSQLDYEQEGMGRRHLRGALAQEPLSLGDLRILGLRLTHSPDERRLEIRLSEAQAVDGWLCATERDVLVTRAGNRLALDLCALQPLSVGSLDWPSGTLVRRDHRGDWELAWFNNPRSATEDCEQVMEAFGFRFNNLQATYDPQRQLQQWRGTTCNAEARVGRYTFAAWATVALQPDGSLQIVGKGRDQRGVAVDCLELVAGRREARRCGGA